MFPKNFVGKKFEINQNSKMLPKCHYKSKLFNYFLSFYKNKNIKMQLNIDFLKFIFDLRKYDNLKKSLYFMI